jgi:sulfite reductase (NADPH) hemoprotein beta-component
MTLAAVHSLTCSLATSTLALPSLSLPSPALPPLVPTHTLLDASSLSFVYLTPSHLSSLLPTLSELLRYPVVLQLPISSVATDLKQVINLRAAGWVVLISSDAQQAYDHTLLASRLAKSTSRAVLHAFNAVDDASIAQLSTEEAKAFLASPSPAASPKVGSTDDDKTEDADRTLLQALDAASLALLKAVRRPQRSTIVHSAKAEAKTLLITVGTTSLAALERADDVAIVELSVLRPINKDKLIAVIPETVERVIVLEQDYSLAPGSEDVQAKRFGGAWLDILDIVSEVRQGLQIHGGVLADISSFSKIEDLSAPFVVGSIPSGPAEVPQTLEDTKTVKIPAAESTYTSLLESSFPASTLQILNDPKKLSAIESTSPEYAYGKAVSELSDRELLVTLVKQILKDSNTDEKTHKALGDWLIDRDDFKGKADAAGRAAIDALESAPKTETIERVLGLKQHFNKHSRWIVSSNSWSYDLGTSGLHHALSGGKNINMLVYETSPSPFSPDADLIPTTQKDKKDRKKDLGLYALNMGDVYVASVAVYSSYATVLQAMEEAEKFDGPSLVLAYLPWGEVESPKVGALERLRETKRAVGGGWWPLYRYVISQSVADSMLIVQVEPGSRGCQALQPRCTSHQDCSSRVP